MGHQPHKWTTSGFKPPTQPNTVQADSLKTHDRCVCVCVLTVSASGFRGDRNVLLKSDAFAQITAANSCADPAGKKISHHIQMNVTF